MAIKQIKRIKPTIDKREAVIHREVNILKQLDHVNIVKCFGFYETPDLFSIAMEYMDGGELFNRIVAKKVYTEKEARDVVQLIMSALDYCHSNNIVHR